MKVEVDIRSGLLRLPDVRLEGCGAVARFDGVVRAHEAGRRIEGLFYEAYAAMAEKEIRRILADLGRAHPFALARVSHRTGFVPAGEAAVVVEVHSRHREAAFAVVGEFMDRLKTDVPIWKTGSR